MSFRKKHRQAQEKEESDVKVSHAKDSQTPQQPSAQEQSSEQQAAQQTSGQQSGQESGQPSEQESTEESDEQSTPEDEKEEEDDKSDSEPVPEGTTAEILRWVGDDKDRAKRALDKEQQNERPRAGLTGELNKVLEA